MRPKIEEVIKEVLAMEPKKWKRERISKNKEVSPLGCVGVHPNDWESVADNYSYPWSVKLKTTNITRYEAEDIVLENHTTDGHIILHITKDGRSFEYPTGSLPLESKLRDHWYHEFFLTANCYKKIEEQYEQHHRQNP